MWSSRGAVYLLFTTALCYLETTNTAHEPPAGTPVFVRSSVESPPQGLDDEASHLRFSIKPTFGDTFLPLRSAVESAPPVQLSSTRSFIRESVEFRPISSEKIEAKPSKVTLRRRVQQKPTSQLSGQYSAYHVPNTYDAENPQPFRSGSPYQQIVDVSSAQLISPEILKLYQYEEQQDAVRVENLRRMEKNNDEKKVLCYITNWSFYRMRDGQFVPEMIDSKLCTHIVYSFGSLEPHSLTIKEFDPWADVENDLYRRTTGLGVPVLLAIGGWTDSTSDKYSRLISSDSARRNFASTTVTFLRKYGFSGLHFDWNYPKCWQSDCRKGPPSDKPNFTKLIQEINKEFQKQNPPLELGVAISGYKEVITEAYELAKLSAAVNFLTVMTYDYHGAWEDVTGHVSPLYGRPSDKYPQYNTDYTMQLLVMGGAAREKLIMGVPFYGQSFALADTHTNLVGEGTPARGPGNAGEATRQPGMLAYYEICGLIRKQKWQTGRDNTGKSGPYATYRNQWVGFEDPESLTSKAKYVMKSNFGGIAAWTIDLDDFMNKCCVESFPLLRAINRAFGRIATTAPAPGNCARPETPATPVPPVMTIPGDHGGGGEAHHEHTTWPAWNPTSTTAKTSTTPKEEATTSPTTASPITTKSTTMLWWQPSSTESSTWWAPTSTTSRTTTHVPSTTTVAQTTTHKPSTWWSSPATEENKPSTWWSSTTSTPRPITVVPASSSEPAIIPAPVNIMPVVIDGESCEVGEYRAHPYNCNAYFRCVYGKLTQLLCAGGLHWNAKGTLCDWPAVAQCKEQQQSDDGIAPIRSTSTSSTARPTTTTTTTTTERTTRAASSSTTRYTTTRKPQYQLTTSATPEDKCISGQYYPDKKDCGNFYICVNEKLVLYECGPGLQWSQSQLGCDRETVVRCVSTERYLRLTHSRASLDDPCEGSTHVPFPGDCEKFLLCNHNQLQEGNCAPGLHWNQVQKICDWPLNAHCKESTGDVVSGGTGNSEIDDLNEIVPTTKRPATTTQKPRPTTERVPVKPHSGHYKLVCYFTNWAWYRSGVGKYTPDDIDTDLCTHIVYGFAVLDYSELTIRTHDSWADIDNNFYDRVARLKEKGVTVSLALGGWNDSQGDKYSRLVRNAAARSKFVRQALQFVEKYGFGGLDLDWEYPVCWQTECNKGFADEKEGFTELVKELSTVFRPKGLVLSTAVSPSKQIIDAGYDVPTLSEYFDWIAVMTYDFHGQWDKKTGHVAPLFYHPEDDISYFNANFSLNYWMEKGAPARKLVMGMPLYGQSFTLSDTKSTGLNSRAPGPGTAGEFTKAAGFLAYYEICDRVRNREWTVVQDPKGRMGPYAYKGNQWVSYDDKAMLRKKSQLVRSLGLGGGMVWALDLDDFKNRCDEGAHPLLTEIQRVLCDPPQAGEHGSFGGETDVEQPPQIVTEEAPVKEPIAPVQPESPVSSVVQPSNEENVVETSHPETEVEIINEIPQNDEEYKVVCYFTNWAWYRQGGGKYVPEDIDARLCSHIVYGFAVLNRDTLTIKPHDSWADLDNRFYERVVAFKAKGIKVTVAIGGWNDSAGDKYSRLVRSAAARAKFISTVIEFIEKNGFDGLDLDWEYPVCWQVDCKQGYPDEKQGFSDLVRELSAAFKPRGLLLSSAVSPSKKVMDAGYDIPTLSSHFDWIAVMTYDFHGQWDKKTGHVAPMYVHPDDFDKTFNANYSINYWISEGADPKKLVMGMPMYGQSFSLADNVRNTLNSPTYGGGEAGEETRARGFLSYYEICQNIKNRKWQVVRDRKGRMGPYAYLRDQWVSFDDANMIRHKSEFVKAMGLGGAMIWALDLDDFRNLCECEEYPLLKTINRVLRNFPGPHPRCRLELQSEVSTEAPIDNDRSDDQTTSNPKVYTTKPSVDIPKRSSTPPTRPPSPDQIDFTCNNKMFTAHPTDCNKYYQCQFGTLLEQRCPPGLHWNVDHCDWPQMANCIGFTDYEETVEVETTNKPPKSTTSEPASEVTSNPSVLVENPITQRPTPVIVNDPSGYKVVCYFTNWAWYRPGEGKYTPNDIDENLCTHVVYGFAVLNRDTLTIKTHDSWADIDNRFYERVVELRSKGVRVTLAIGGWNDSLGDKYSRLVLDPAARARFVKHVADFIAKYNFEGLDLDWEYPVCWQVECDKGSPKEKQGFTELVKELALEFRPRGWLLSAAVSPSKKVIDAGYDVPTLAEYFDWISVMTYDYHGQWDKQTGHVAPLYYVPGDTYDYFNANFTLRYWIEQGAPPKKLVMGMPMYGQSFSLTDLKKNGLNQKAGGPGQAGQYTRAAGFLAYYEICQKVSNGGWTVVRDTDGRIGPYAHSGSQWVSYDDVADIRRKAQFVKELGLGGGMIWALDLDDFKGRCGCGKHPLLRTLNQELRGLAGQRASDCT